MSNFALQHSDFMLCYINIYGEILFLQIFKKYNIIEYKSPDDHLTINDFYKVYGYCCFYQSDTNGVCQIPPEELTITFVCNHFPRKMIQHLKNFRGLNLARIEPGIYYIIGDAFPIQLLITNELDPNENRWLQSLRNDITKIEEIEPLFKEYESLHDINQVAQILKLSVEQVEKAVAPDNPI